MNEIIKVREDQLVAKIHANNEHALAILDWHPKYSGKRKKYTYQIYEELTYDHASYEGRTAYNYMQYLVAEAQTLRNYIDAINPERTTDIEFINEIIVMYKQSHEIIGKHLSDIDHNQTSFQYYDESKNNQFDKEAY